MKRAPSDSKDFASIRCAGIEEMVIEISDICQRVVECTDYLTGGNSVSVSSSPIFLTVYKQDIQDDLTLIDLPGEYSLHQASVKNNSEIFLE